MSIREKTDPRAALQFLTQKDNKRAPSQDSWRGLGATVCQGVRHQAQTTESGTKNKPSSVPPGTWLFPLAQFGGWGSGSLSLTHSLTPWANVTGCTRVQALGM